MLINGIRLLALRNSEFLQFNKDVLEIVRLNDPAALKVPLQYKALQDITETIDALFKTEKGSATTQVIIDLDLRRDKAIIGLAAIINGYTYHFDEGVSAAAGKLQFNLANYGASIARENYQSETAIISNVIADWTNKPELAAAVQQLQLGDWIAELTVANNEFNKVYISRTQEFAAASPDTIFEKRQEATQLYYNLRDMLNAWFTITQGAAPFNKATQECNALIDQYNKLVATNGDTGGEDIPPAISVPAT